MRIKNIETGRNTENDDVSNIVNIFIQGEEE